MFKVLALLLIAFSFIASPVSAFAATLTVTPSTGVFNRGCTFTLGIDVDTQGVQTDGADAILLYDATRFTATKITEGTFYEEYPGNSVATSGKVIVSGLASVTSAVSGKGTLATVEFSVKENAPTGATQINFDFDSNDKAKTTDSNIVQRGTIQDVLSSVVNGNYTVGTGGCTAQTVTGTGASTIIPVSGSGVTFIEATPSGGVEIPQKTLPAGGTETLTYTVAIVGTILTVLGILGLALL